MKQLTEKQLQSYEENGFLIIDDYFSKKELDDFSETLRRTIQAGLKSAAKKYPEIYYEDFIGKEFDEGIRKLEEVDHSYVANIYDSIAFTPEFLRLISKPETSTIVNQVLKKDPRSPLYTFSCRVRMVFPGKDRRYAGWHQEVFYTIPHSRYLQTWAPLVRNATKENGTIVVCAGSHKENIANQTWNGDPKSACPFVIKEDIIRKYEHKDVEVKLGQFLIFSGYLIHKSGDNISNEVRYSLVGMHHDIDNPDFWAPTPRHEFKIKSPLAYYQEIFKINEAQKDKVSGLGSQK